MASNRSRAAVTAACGSLLIFCLGAGSHAGSNTVRNPYGASPSATVRNPYGSPLNATVSQQRRTAPLRGTIGAIGEWDQVPAVGDSVAPAGRGAPATFFVGSSAPAGDHPHRGPATAPVTIVEYSDFQCPYCRSAEPTIQAVRAKYGIIYMDFPLGFHSHAVDAALAARCAREQGRFWAYHDALFSGASGLSTPALEQVAAATSGLDSASFDRCLSQRKYQNAIESDLADGRQAGVSGTPTFFINGARVVGTPALPNFERMIDDALAAQARK